ncbi:MAG: vWA domain-containing protein [Planctomycetota bacterium]
MIDVDIEEPAISRGMLRSWISLGVSCVTHLILFVALTLVVYTANRVGVIELQAETVAQQEDFHESLDQEIRIEAPTELLESEPEILTEALEEVPLEEAVDWSAALADSAYSVAGESDLIDTEFAETTSGGFFGIKPTGNRIVYIIDMSPSMANGNYERRFDRAVSEVLSSVDQLAEEQTFFVYLFCFEKREMNIVGARQFCFPTKENKVALAKWLTDTQLDSGTDPREALVAALKMKPSCCFLLSDGEFNGRRYGTGKYGGGRRAPTTVELARKHNLSGCPIHTIGLEDEGSQKMMTQIAEQSNGLYKFIPELGGFDD